MTLRRKDGELIWASVTARVVRNGKGDVLYYEGSLEDVTERKTAEEEINRLVSIIRNSSELICLSDMDGRIVFLNDAGTRLLGIDPENVEKTNINQMIPDHMRGLAENEIFPAVLSGKSWRGELQTLNLKTGCFWDTHSLIFPIDDPLNPNKKYLANISLDITHQKQTENMMREKDEILANITKYMQGMVFQAYAKDNGEWVMVYASEGATSLLGLSGNLETLPQEFHEHVHEEDKDRYISARMKSLETFAPFDIEFRFIKSTGEVLWLNGTGTPRQHENRLVFDGLILNISERKQAEEKIREEEETLAGIAKNFPGIIYQFYAKDNGEWGMNYASEGMVTFFGLSGNLDTMFQEFYDHVYDEDKEKFIDTLKKSIETSTPVNIEFRFRNPSGEVLWVQGLGTPRRHKGYFDL
jgi:PAS domain S-box-containing protein